MWLSWVIFSTGSHRKGTLNMAAPKLFTDADAWFADRGYTREKSKEPTWSKQLEPYLEINISGDPIKLSSGLYNTGFIYTARFPQLAKLHSSLHLPNSKMGKPVGKMKGSALKPSRFTDAYSHGYEPFEPSGSGPNWEAFFKQFGAALPKIEAELTDEPDFRHNIETGQYWQVSNFRFSEMLILLYFKEWDKAQHMLDTTDWRKVINPQNIADMPNKPTTDEDVRNVTEQLANYINTHRNNS